jgi:hypothetical protein
MKDRCFENINKILDLYKNGLSAGFENGIFKEDSFLVRNS